MNLPNHKIEKISNYGTEEPWVARIMFSLLHLVDQLTAPEYQKNEIKKWILEIAKELTAAFDSIKAIEKLIQSKDAALFTSQNHYKNAYTCLWRAYKDRFQKTCKAIGYDIGFLFKSDKDFEKESIEFIRNNPEIPDRFRKMLKIDRRVWQNGLADFRNLSIEHREIGEELEEVFFQQESLKTTFDNVWQTIEESIVVLVDAKLEEPLTIAEIPEEERDSECPERFKIGLAPKTYESLKNAK